MFNSVQEEKQKNEGKKTDEPKNLAVDFCVQRMSANWLWILILDLLQAIWKFDKLKNQTFKKKYLKIGKKSKRI